MDAERGREREREGWEIDGGMAIIRLPTLARIFRVFVDDWGSGDWFHPDSFYTLFSRGLIGDDKEFFG